MSIRQLLLCGVLSVVAAACTAPMGHCDENSDCGAGGVCDSSCDCCLYPAPQGGSSDGGQLADAGPEQCVPACAEHQQCVGTTCEARYASIAIEAPATRVRVKQNDTVLVTAKLVRADGRTSSPRAQLVLAVTPPGQAAFDVPMNPTLTKDTYVGNFTATLGGVYHLVVRYPGANLTSPAVDVSSDGVSPNLTVSIAPPPARHAPSGGTTWTDTLNPAWAAAHRRDEVATIYVSSGDDDVKGDSVTVELKVGSGAARTWPVQGEPAQSCSGSAKWCGRVDVKLWELQMNAFHAEFEVTATVRDLVGNAGTSASTRGKITRFKWVHEADSNPIRGTVAVAGSGRVVGGTSNGGSSGKLFALSGDGRRQWEQPIGAIVASPAIGDGNATTQTVYVAATDATGPGLWALDLASGAPLTASACRIAAGGSTVEASVALSKTKYDVETAPIETATAVINGVARLLSLRPGSAVDGCLQKAGAGNLSYPDAIVSQGSAIYYTDTNGVVRGYDFHSVDVWRERFAPISGNFGARSFVIDGTNLVSASASGVFVMTTSGVAGWTHGTSVAGGLGVMGAQSQFYAGLGDNTLLRVTVGDSTSAQPVNMNGIVQAAPLLGEGGWVYAAGNDGTLVAHKETEFGTHVWSVGGLGVVEASLNIDCARDASTGQKRPGVPGVLYVANSAGRLYALVVDSRGIDTTAPWPKYQHDPRNTGNADTALSEFACD
ncbi:MAG: hypothetical protein WBV82_01950 [Myxococcaceae bacterium]